MTRRYSWIALFLLAAPLLAAAGCGPRTVGAASDAGTPDAPPALPDLTGITVMPAMTTLSATVPGSPATATFTAIGHFASGPDQDISHRVVWAVDNVMLGSFSGNQFTTSGAAAGQGTVTATNGGISGSAALTVMLTVSIVAAGGSPAVPSNPGGRFGGSVDPSRAPTIYYPYDNVMLPPNLGQLEVQWDPGPATNTLFRIEIKAPLSDVSVYTRCTPAPTATRGCSYDFTPAGWSLFAPATRGGSVQLTVAATDDSGSGVGISTAQTMSFTADNIQGGLYYWTTSGGSSIMRYDFGATTTTASRYIDPTAVPSGDCVGCHAVSHDGKKIAANFDNDGSFNDGKIGVFNVATRALAIPFPLPQMSQFQAWSPDGSTLVGVYGDNGVDLNLLLFDGNTGAHTGDIALGGWEASHPDYAPDGNSIAFTHVGIHDISQCFGEGAIAAVHKTATGWSAPADIIPRETGKNHYYPAYSPDGSLLAFDTSICGQQAVACVVTWVTVDCSCDADSDPSATLYYVPANAAPGTSPIAFAHANTGHPAADGGNTLLTNSWPKWSPFLSHKTVGGARVAWLTFSSTRAFGFRQLPGGSDENPSGSYIWMTAIDLDRAEVGAPGDPSYPPFVLPFQDFTTSNHIAQWTTQIVALQ